MLSYLEFHKLRESTKVLCTSSCLETLDNHGNMQKLIFVPIFLLLLVQWINISIVQMLAHLLPPPACPFKPSQCAITIITLSRSIPTVFSWFPKPNFYPNEFLIALDLNKYWAQVALVGKCRFTKFGIGLALPLPPAAQSIRVEKCKSNVMHKSRATVKRNVFCRNLLLMGRGVHRITFFSPLSQRPQEKKH